MTKRDQWQQNLLDVMQTRGDGTIYFPQYTSFGCYPIGYYTKEGDFLCANCATKNLMSEWGDLDEAEYADVYYEGPPLECQCGTVIDSAYGDPEENRILDHISEITRNTNCIGRYTVWGTNHANPYDPKHWLISDMATLKNIRDHIAQQCDTFYDNLPDSALDAIDAGAIRAAIRVIAKTQS